MKYKNLMLLSFGLVTSISVFSVGTKPAQAWPGWRTEELGTYSNYSNYYRAKGRMVLPTPPSDKDDFCRFQTGRGDAKGTSAGLLTWATRCYRSYWVWW